MNEETLSRMITQQLVEYEYDIVACIDPNEKQISFRYASSEYKEYPQIHILDYDQHRYGVAKYLIRKEDQEGYLSHTKLSSIVTNLNKTGKYSFISFRMGKEHRYKKYQYKWLIPGELILFTIKDIHDFMEEQRRHVQEIESAMERERAANQAKTEFLSNMSHDIRTPMNAIINLTSLTLDVLDDPKKVEENLLKIQTSGEFLLTLINDVLDLSKLGYGKMKLQPEVYPYVEFKKYINSVFEPFCEFKQIFFYMNIAPCARTIFVDRLRFNQIFFNLLSNAVKYTPMGGKIQFAMEIIKEDQDYIDAKFIVKDNGAGIEPDRYEKIFEPYEQGQDGRDSGKGTGLGLAIVKNIVKLMGGHIKVESSLKEGTTFYVLLKLKCASKEQIAAYDQMNDNSDRISCNGKKILIVEDHQLNREILECVLAIEGMETVSVTNGKECLEAYEAHEPFTFDCILMDVRMPVMDGLQATELIRKSGRQDAKVIPILAITANAFEEDRAREKEVGMNGYIEKPFKRSEMLTIIERYIVSAEGSYTK